MKETWTRKNNRWFFTFSIIKFLKSLNLHSIVWRFPAYKFNALFPKNMLLHYLVGKTIEKYSSRFKFRSTKYRHYGGSNAKFDRPLNFPLQEWIARDQKSRPKTKEGEGHHPKNPKEIESSRGRKKEKGGRARAAAAPRPPWPPPPPAARRSCWGPPPPASSTRGASPRRLPPRPRQRFSSTRAPAWSARASRGRMAPSTPSRPSSTAPTWYAPPPLPTRLSPSDLRPRSVRSVLCCSILGFDGARAVESSGRVVADLHFLGSYCFVSLPYGPIQSGIFSTLNWMILPCWRQNVCYYNCPFLFADSAIMWYNAWNCKWSSSNT